MRCPSCGASNADSQKFCGTCGGALSRSEDETVASPAPPRFVADAGRFVPGQMLTDRYRMVGLLGRGGMGEVYRADDLKLGQPVALKFLPRDVEADRDRLDRFLTEVRLSLRVTHPNVCRVFDIGQVDGPSTSGGRSGQVRHFLSMEYVDGEDLASLLRRIGRLPEDKAVEIARQLCAGLAAAHDEGVLHRDLKPANIMIDGRGRAKITDFGLAGATAGIVGREAQSGTPQYMAPEQFDGRELTVQTDLYALGLVLYEVFTGKRAHDSQDLLELAKMQTSAPTSPATLVSGLNPVVERAILRCLDADPAKRPKSAESLAAALPGGDPLAMAIAAGETPSPEMVARSGGGGELRPAVAVACLGIVLAGLVAVWMLAQRLELHNRVPLPKPPAELRVLARAALVEAGYTGGASGIAFGFSRDADYFNKITTTDTSVGRWDNLATVSPAPVWFWYRESLQPMSPFSNVGRIAFGNPPTDLPGMKRVRLDPSGRLQELVVVPADKADGPGPWSEPDWSPLFKAAGFVPGDWTASPPEWTSPNDSDVKRAWTRGTLRIEAASFRGRPVWFRVVPEWRRPAEVRLSAPDAGQRAADLIRQAMILLMIVGGLFFARRNLRQGRSDRQGALRFAAAFLLLGAAQSLVGLQGDPRQWLSVFVGNLGWHLYLAALVWLFYTGIEPYVRRLWPRTLVAWTRALEGRFRDPMVGRHILLGAAAGIAFSFLFSMGELASGITGVAPVEPPYNLSALESGRAYLWSAIGVVQNSFLVPVGVLLAVLVLRVILRRTWIAYIALYVVTATIALLTNSGLWAVINILVLTLVLAVLTRLGLLAFVVAIMFSSWPALPLTTDTSSWIFATSVVVMLVFAAVAAYGFWVSLGDQKVFKESMMD